MSAVIALCCRLTAGLSALRSSPLPLVELSRQSKAMAPKKRVLPPQSRGPGWQEAVASFGHTQLESRPSEVNASHYAAVAQALEVIMAHPAFDGLSSMAPLPLDQGGQCAPFNVAEFKMKMSKREIYTCGANLLWMNNLWSCAPQVPVNRAGVAALRSCVMRSA